MTQPATQNGATAPAAPAPPPPPSPPKGADLDVDGEFLQRSAGLEEQLRAETVIAKAEEADALDAAEGAAQTTQAMQAVPAAIEAPAAAAPVKDAATQRKERLAKLAEEERAKFRAKTEHSERDREIRELKARLEKSEAKAPLADRIERAVKDPDEFMALLSEHVSPEKLSEWLVEQSQPERLAERRAKKAIEPASAEAAAVRAELAELKATLAQKEQDAQEVRGRQMFAERVAQVRAEAPHTARWLEKRPAELIKLATAAAGNLPDGATFDDVIGVIEEHLSEFASDFQPASPTQQNSTEQKTNLAAAKAPTLSNRAAAERSSILSGEEESLSLDERAARLERRVRQEQRSG